MTVLSRMKGETNARDGRGSLRSTIVERKREICVEGVHDFEHDTRGTKRFANCSTTDIKRVRESRGNSPNVGSSRRYKIVGCRKGNAIG